MIYTIGSAAHYLYGLETQRNCSKLGRNLSHSYDGGSVWRTAKEAWDHIRNNSPRLESYSVFEVEANWDEDVAEHPEGLPWHLLLKTSRITREIPEKVKRTQYIPPDI